MIIIKQTDSELLDVWYRDRRSVTHTSAAVVLRVGEGLAIKLEVQLMSNEHCWARSTDNSQNKIGRQCDEKISFVFFDKVKVSTWSLPVCPTTKRKCSTRLHTSANTYYIIPWRSRSSLFIVSTPVWIPLKTLKKSFLSRYKTLQIEFSVLSFPPHLPSALSWTHLHLLQPSSNNVVDQRLKSSW